MGQVAEGVECEGGDNGNLSRRVEYRVEVAVRVGMVHLCLFMSIFRRMMWVVGLAVFAPAATAQVKVSLVAPVLSVQPGQPFEVALRIEHESTWHTYWINAGTGYATSLKWDLPEGWSAGEIEWPVPVVIHDYRGVVTGQGYDGVTLLPVKITPPADMESGSKVTLKATADWLMCDPNQCKPGNAPVSLELAVSAADPKPSAQAGEFAGIARPQAPPAGVTVQVARMVGDESDRVVLWIKGAKPVAPHFFTENNFIAYDAGQETLDGATGGVVLHLKISPAADPQDTRLRGVFAFGAGENRTGWLLNEGVDIIADGPRFSVTRADAGTTTKVATGLLGTLGLALVGGLILNLMPCVFPVLGIKILGFVKQAGSDRRKVTLHGLAFAGGVLVSFWMLAAGLAVLRAGGAELGWGFQLQSPGFVFSLAVLMLVFALSMSGVFEFGLSAIGVGSGLQRKDGLTGSFFTGVLATVVATPCSAPFLAPALGAALALPTGQGFVVFTAIAVGLALPYLLLSLFPQAVKLLPRPGAWMETFKQVMAFPLYATVGYLLWVLAGQTGDQDLLKVFFGLTVVALAVWLYGRYATPVASSGRRRFGTVGGLVLLMAGVALGWPVQPSSDAIVWEHWEPGRAEQLQAEGKPVYVDFTARWCATCQANKQVVFGSEEVRRYFRDHGVVALKADWTSADPLITAELAKWGRSAVPFNLIYRPDGSSPEALPELLTPSIVLEALKGQNP